MSLRRGRCGHETLPAPGNPWHEHWLARPFLFIDVCAMLGSMMMLAVRGEPWPSLERVIAKGRWRGSGVFAGAWAPLA